MHLTLKEILFDLFSGTIIIGGLLILKRAFRKLKPEDVVAGKKELPAYGWGSKANLVYVGAGLVILGVYAIFKFHSK